MCLIALAYKVHPDFSLIVAANRDEFHARKASPAHFWTDHPGLLAGKDHQGGGTWSGITTQGRFAALTNYRDLRRPQVKGGSRGILVRQVLQGLNLPETKTYEGFNLIHGAIDDLRYHSNISDVDAPLSPGVHGVSNHLLDTPWPKVEHAKARMRDVLTAGTPEVEALFDLLNDGVAAPDEDLPDTGIGLEWERQLGSIFIDAVGYGTRCSTVITVSKQGRVRFEERTHPPDAASRVVFEFDL